MVSTTTTLQRPLDGDVHQLAESLRPDIESARDEAERARRLPGPLLERLRAAGAFRLLTPRELGGFELSLADVLGVYESFGRIDGPVAWNVWNGNLGFAAALLEPPGVEAIWGSNPDPVIANSARTTGHAQPTAGGFALSGRWDLVSAIDSADWVALFGIVMDGAGPRFVAEGEPDVRAFFLPRRDITVLDTWHVNAMRGTGSNSVVLDSVHVPEALAPSPFAPSRIDRPTYRIPAFTLASTGCAAVVVGVAQAAIDALVALAASKPTDTGAALADRAHAQAALGAAHTSLRAARLLLHEAAADIDAAASIGPGQVTAGHRLELRSAMSHAAATSRDVLNAMYQLGSSSALYVGDPLERLFRDGHAAAQHALLNPTHLELTGRRLLGRDPGVPVF
jgi:alkylation response protein AidB-like acyl-CoA dehydrogenase